MKDLTMVGVNIKKMEKQQGDNENLMRYEMSQTEIQASSSSMRLLKKLWLKDDHQDWILY